MGVSAVVAVIVSPILRNDAEVLLIERSNHPLDPWAGHMAFPGGKIDKGDSSLAYTALRETKEELGIQLTPSQQSKIEIPIATAGIHIGKPVYVQPIIFECMKPSKFLIDETEIADFTWVPLKAFHESSKHKHYELVNAQPLKPGVEISFNGKKKIVWGMTYNILVNLSAEISKS